MAANEIMHEKRDILGAFTERRDKQWENAEPVIKDLPARAPRNPPPQGAGPRLDKNQHGRVRVGDQSHFVQDFRKGATVAYDLTEIVRCFDLLQKVLVLEAELAKRVLSAPALVDIAEDQSKEPSAAHARLRN